MARTIGAKCRQCRREGVKLFLKGERCHREKCAVTRREGAIPGVKVTQKRFGKLSQFGQQQREKQKVKRTYGVLEQQFRGYYHKAAHMKGVTGENLLSLLERRLDNVVFRLGLGVGRTSARQLVLHGHVRVNGRRVDVPSFSVKAGDVVTVKDASREVKVVKEGQALRRQRGVVSWLALEADRPQGKVLRLPARADVDMEVRENLIVELYSK